jgi:hypothetical protein
MIVKKPQCVSCPHRISYCDPVPKQQYGVMMHLGDHFCVGAKKARRFKNSDPKVYVPSWCPIRKSPCELRVYTFKSADDWLLYKCLCRSLGQDIPPEGHRYTVAFELHTTLSPQEFGKRCDGESSQELLHVTVNQYDVVEIDDGIQPVFFFKTDRGYELAPFFNAAAARKNHKKIE